MASKFGMPGGIPERRVRSIWDAVDSRQFKAALKLATSLLSKYPNSPYALALKALILERMGKPDEALSVCLNAKDKLYANDAVQIDDLTLSTLQIVFQRLDRLDLATSCYEFACGKFPNNLELMMGLFNCYVREYSFVKQQQTAIKMYKVVGEERFLLWAVCSIQLQMVYCHGKPTIALSNGHKDKTKWEDWMAWITWIYGSVTEEVLCGDGEDKLLLLAEGLLKKHITSHSLHEPEALLVYISVLEQQAKYGAASEILSGKLGSLLIIEVDRLRIQGRLLARACDYAAAAEIYQKVIESCPDDWECFLHYLGCLLEDDSSWCSWSVNDKIHPPKFVDCKLSHLKDDVFDLQISNALAFVQKLQVESSSDFIRCPYLANLEIERRKRLYGKGDDMKLIEALLDYFCSKGNPASYNCQLTIVRFGHLACFASDVEMFLQVLTIDEKMDLLKKLMKLSGSSSTVPIKVLGQSITLFKIQELFGTLFKLPVSGVAIPYSLEPGSEAADVCTTIVLPRWLKLESTAIQMTDMYCQNLPLSKDLDPQENMHGEELLSMACNVLIQLFWRTRHLGYLLEAIMVLEFGLTIRRYVWQYKILLLHLYSYLSALPLAYEWYKTLEVKNILFETVSHHILPQMLISPLWVDLIDLLKDYLKFMDDHSRESADLTFLAYRHRNYSKVIEFVQFKERLQHSNQYLMAKIEEPILQLKQKSDNIEEVECVLESLSFGMELLELSSENRCKSLTFNEDLQSRPWWTPAADINYLLGPFDGASFCPRENLCSTAFVLFPFVTSIVKSEVFIKFPFLISWKLPQTKEREANARKVIERRSLLPRMLYLSIQCASSSMKENVETNGSISNTKLYSELKCLLERFAKSLGFPFNDAVKDIVGLSIGDKSFEVFNSDIIDWMNFAVFLNAWNLGSHELNLPDGDGRGPVSWHMVDYLIEKYTLENLRSMQPLIRAPGSDLPVLVQLVTEPLAWHGLVINSCVRSSLPSGKKKKKSGHVDQLNSLLSQAIQGSIQSVCGVMEEVTKWLREQINKPEDENLDTLLSLLMRRGLNEGPGQVFQILEAFAASTRDSVLCDRISQALLQWSPVGVARKIITSQCTVLSEFLRICESNLKSLKALKQ
ncbi:hypothetical protein HHK36_010647 [Tetracentron sinense]|uniref:Phagocyte signaling-impaired protein n=1 Tax=Tetracentron sinense TaxID=13715 RepID=A0A834ZEP3_TETSI|nr:hypothetical protein HHK36_010647 [Tetracentron sinense]